MLAFYNSSDDKISSINNEIINVITRSQQINTLNKRKTQETLKSANKFELTIRKNLIRQENNETVQHAIVFESIFALSSSILRAVLLALQGSDQLAQRIRPHVLQTSMERSIEMTDAPEILEEILDAEPEIYPTSHETETSQSSATKSQRLSLVSDEIRH